MPPYLEEQTAGRSWGVGRRGLSQSHFSESVRAAGRTLILSVIAVALLVSRSTAVSPMREVRRVLIINDLGVVSSPGFSEINQAILTGLQKSPYRIEFYEESLDLTLFPGRVSQDRFREEIIQKYSARKPDVIIAAGPESLKFIANLYDKFQGTPIIFCAILGGIPDQLRHGMSFTGVLAQLHPEGTLNAALRLLPSTKHVVVIGGVGKFDEGFEAIAKQSFHNYESQLEFTYLFDLTMPALLERLKQLPSDTIVYHTAITQDAAGDRFIDSAQSIPMVASAANAPVFVMDDVDLRAGTVGGDLVHWADDGRVAAEMAVRVLNGENPQNIPVVTNNHAYMFDWRSLKRWGINEKNLPPGSIVLNRQPTAWESYKWYIIGGIALILLEALLIGGLVWQRAEQKRAEAKVVSTAECLRRLSARLLHAQDEERRRIARQLHETAAQDLSALKMNLARMGRFSGAVISPVLAESITLTDGCLQELRTLSHLLYPPLLEEAGLLSALRWYVAGFSERSGIAATLDAPAELERLPRETEIAIFRVVQEALTNIHRHSGSHSARVQLNRNSNSIHLQVKDEGKGMEKGARETEGVGIAGMRERVQELGGTFDISNGNGTLLEAIFPIGEVGSRQKLAS